MHKAYETIWLQVDPDGESYDPEQWDLEDDATWCKDQINANDVEYVRADIAEAKLAAEQAKNVKLLDFIARAQVSSGVCCCGEPMDGHPSPMSCGHSPVDMWDHAVRKLLDAPSDTSALGAIVKKAGEVMREECITAAGPEDSYQDDWIRAKIDACDAIRTIPAVTLEDLK